MSFSTHKNFNPSILFQKLHLHSGMHVADFGCGRTGRIVFPAADMVGEQGVVYAVDILHDMLELVDTQAKRDAYTMIHPVWADVERVGSCTIPEATLDVMFIINMLHLVKHKTNVLYEAKRLLKSKGRIVIVDWHNSTLPIAPKKEQVVNFQEVEIWGREHDFAVQETFDMGPSHRGVILYRHK